LKSHNGKWGEIFKFGNDDDDEFFVDEALDVEGKEGDGILFLQEAHQALNKLSQKTNNRGKLMRQPRKAESWH
jgi:hypothetical protein